MDSDGHRRGSIKRVSLVRLRRDLPLETCLSRWKGPHASIVRELPGVLEYTVDVAVEDRDGDDWSAIATLRFEDAEALRNFERPEVQERLLATRDDFATAADVFFVDEHILIPTGGNA